MEEKAMGKIMGILVIGLMLGSVFSGAVSGETSEEQKFGEDTKYANYPKPDSYGADSPEDAPPKKITAVTLPSAAAFSAPPSSSENVKTFITDTAPKLDWYLCLGNIIDFSINVSDINVSEIKSATLTLEVFDVDIPGTTDCGPEIDTVEFNGYPIGILTGANDQWSTCAFDIDPSYIVKGDNFVVIDIDSTGSGCWCVECDWGELEVTLALKPPKIEKINVTGIPDTKNPMANDPSTAIKEKVKLEATITPASGFEVYKISWWGDVTHGEGPLSTHNPYEYTAAPGTHGGKVVGCTILYKNNATGEIDADVETKYFKLFFRKGAYPNWADDGKPGGPNWFKYWKRDGAVPKMDNAIYNPNKGGYGYAIGNQAYLCKKAAGQHYHR